jgi:predicted P-loop ATPase
LEWAELERALSRRSTGDVKSFLSSCVDNLRVPYGRTVEAFPRHCIMTGTTNEEEFLADSTGDRRFWVIPVQKTSTVNYSLWNAIRFGQQLWHSTARVNVGGLSRMNKL